ncbi:MAG: glycosyltransferase family 2 protein, partial [Acidiferrobacterales bacterium]
MNVSVIVPVYNRAKLIGRALRSVSSQTVLPHEVIVVDDGSTDETGEVVHARFPQAHYVRQYNKGVSSARNRGIQESNCEWLAFLDSDDEWLPQKLEVQRRALEANHEYRICHSDEIWIRRGQRVNPMRKHLKYGGHIFTRCLPLCVISPSSVVLHRSVLEAVGVFDESFLACEDYDLWLRVCAVYPVLFIAQPLIVKYGGHADQLSRRYSGMDRFRIEALEKIIQSGRLSPADRNAAVDALLEKIGIHLNGAEKRRRRQEVVKYREKQAYYTQLA